MVEKVSVIIKYKDTVTASTLDSVTTLDADIKRVHHSINAVSAIVPKYKIGKIKTDPNVEYVEIDQEAHILGFVDDSLLSSNKKMYAMAQTVPWGVSKIRATDIWSGGNKGTGIKVCVIDTGIDYNHEDLKGNYKGGYNFLNNTDNPMDDNGHGTHVAGTIAALDNDMGVIGVAPEASIYSLKVLDANGSGSYSNIISAIDWAINNNMQIISMSLGGGFSQALKDICDNAYNYGILLIAAAGNSNGDGSQDTIGYPAKFDSVVAIAATDSNDARASFSSCGPEVELSAPGVNIPSTVPKGTCECCDPSGYKQLSGTSMSTPHVSGTAALILKAHPEMTNADVRKTLQNTAIDLGKQGRDIFFGYGRIDAKAAIDQIPHPQDKYRCTGVPNYQCVVDPNGPYNSLAECQAACKVPVTKYRCTGTPNYQCVIDPNGPYNSLAECQAACKPTPQTKKFKVHIIGTPSKPDGILVMKSAKGDYTADDACKLTCDTIKNMDQ
jgi:subtilisin